MATIHVDDGLALRLLPPVAEGLTNAEVAKHLGLEEGTIKGYLAALYPWLGARNRAHATHLGHLRGYLDPERVIAVTDEAIMAVASAISENAERHLPYAVTPPLTYATAERYLAAAAPHLQIIPAYRLP